MTDNVTPQRLLDLVRRALREMAAQAAMNPKADLSLSPGHTLMVLEAIDNAERRLREAEARHAQVIESMQSAFQKERAELQSNTRCLKQQLSDTVEINHEHAVLRRRATAAALKNRGWTFGQIQAFERELRRRIQAART